MTTTELERAAYMAGDTASADLLARIDDLTADLARAEAENETLHEEYAALQYQRDKLRGELTTLEEKMDALRQRVEAALK
jgi:predicted  nucleic acid-binding Zn-ribbon protein